MHTKQLIMRHISSLIGRLMLVEILFLASFTFICPKAHSQGTVQQHLSLTAYGLFDRHLATGNALGGALLLNWKPSDPVSLRGGIQVADGLGVAGKLEGSATLIKNPKDHRLALENSYLWRHFPQWGLQEFTSALQLAWYADHIQLHLGLCNRYVASLIQRSDVSATILEPMNVMFAAEGWLFSLGQPKSWNVGLRWSNYGDFFVERVSEWTFSLKGRYALNDNLDLMAEVGTHPVGSLNLTASYDGWFGHLGLNWNIK